MGILPGYDQVLGTSLLVDAVPARHRHGDTDLDTCSGWPVAVRRPARRRRPPMTRWFNTNFHYLVPEF